MKIHFLIPPSNTEKTPDRLFGCNYGFFIQQNIFLLYPATLLKEKGFDIEITDCTIEKISLKQALKNEADIYVFYSVFLSRQIDLKAAEQIEKKYPEKPIIFIGPDPTYKPEFYLKKENRFIVRGEPEYTLLELVKAIKSKNLKNKIKTIKGISYLKKGKIIHNKPRDYIKNLDKLPIPDRTLLKKPFSYSNPKFRKQPSTTMITSRGCAFRCYFCIPNSLSFARELEYKRYHKKKPPVTMRSPKNIIQEFKIIKKQGYKSVFIVDDEFVWGKERTLEILKGIKPLNLEIAILARCDMLTDINLVKAMKQAGITYIDLGVESYDQKILDDIKKDLKIETIEKSINNIKKCKIQPEINVMFGASPLETKETIKKTINFVEKLGVDIVHSTICTPFPGTDFREIAIKKGWTENKEYKPIDPGAESLISYPHLSKEELIKATKTLYRRHYFNLRYLLRQIVKVRSLKELFGKIKTAINIWKNIIKKE